MWLDHGVEGRIYTYFLKNKTPDTKEMLHFEVCRQRTWVKTLISSVILGSWMSWKILRIYALYSIPDNIMLSHGLNCHSFLSRGPLNIPLISHALSAQTQHHSSEPDPLPLLLISVRLVAFEEFSLPLSSVFCVSSPPLNMHLGKILQISPSFLQPLPWVRCPSLPA